MRTRATVISVENHIALVECHRTSACEGCHKRTEGSGECTVCSLMSEGSHTQTARAYDSIGVFPGDIVELESDNGRMLLYAVLVFLLPLLLAMAGYWIFSSLFAKAYYGFIGAGASLILSFFALRLYSEIFLKKRLDVTVVAVLEHKEQE